MPNVVLAILSFFYIFWSPENRKLLQKLLGLKHKSSHRRYSVEKSALKDFANFTEKPLCWNLF